MEHGKYSKEEHQKHEKMDYSKTDKSAKLLVSMLPSEAHKVIGAIIEDVKLDDLIKDDIILVKPEEKVPADGIIAEGSSYITEHG